MSRLELKAFSKGKYQKLVLSELSKCLPNIDGSKLKEKAICISNSLDREDKSLLRGRARESTASRKSPCMLSDTIITELEATLWADSTQPPEDTEHSSWEESDDAMAGNDESVN